MVKEDGNMDQKEFYKYYIPGLIKALEMEDIHGEFYVRGPEMFLEISASKKKEIDIYLDYISGKDDFLDNVAYYFDAKSHRFNEINGIKIEIFKKNLEKEILNYKKKYGIK